MFRVFFSLFGAADNLVLVMSECQVKISVTDLLCFQAKGVHPPKAFVNKKSCVVVLWLTEKVYLVR